MTTLDAFMVTRHGAEVGTYDRHLGRVLTRADVEVAERVLDESAVRANLRYAEWAREYAARTYPNDPGEAAEMAADLIRERHAEPEDDDPDGDGAA